MKIPTVTTPPDSRQRSSIRLGLIIGALVLAWYLAAMWMMQA